MSTTVATTRRAAVPRPGRRRLSPSRYRFLLAAHVLVSVGWLGIALAKLVLGIAAVTSDRTGVAAALFLSIDVLNVAFPVVAIATIITGALLSLGTKWGLLRHYWIVTKMVLTVGVIVTAVQLGDRLVAQALTASAERVPAPAPTTFLIALTVAHVLMLAVATVVSVYKPWGRTRLARASGP